MQTGISILWDRAKKRKLISYTFYGDGRRIVKVEQQALRKDFSEEEKEILEARLGQKFIGVNYDEPTISNGFTISNFIKFYVDKKLRKLAYPDEIDTDPTFIFAPYIMMTPTNTPTIGNYKVDTSKMLKGVYYQDSIIDSSSLQKFTTMKIDYSKDSNNNEEGKA